MDLGERGSEMSVESKAAQGRVPRDQMNPA